MYSWLARIIAVKQLVASMATRANLVLVVLYLANRSIKARLSVPKKLVGNMHLTEGGPQTTVTIDLTVDTSIRTCNVNLVHYEKAETFVLKTKVVASDTSKEEGPAKNHELANEGKMSKAMPKHGLNKEKATIGTKRTLKLGSCAHVGKEESLCASGGPGTVATLML